MILYLPGWMLIAAAASLFLFYAANKANRIRRKNRQQIMETKKQAIMQMLSNRKAGKPANDAEKKEPKLKIN